VASRQYESTLRQSQKKGEVPQCGETEAASFATCVTESCASSCVGSVHRNIADVAELSGPSQLVEGLFWAEESDYNMRLIVTAMVKTLMFLFLNFLLSEGPSKI